MDKNIQNFSEFINEASNSSFLHHHFSSFDKDAWKKNCYLPLSYTATDEQIDWAEQRMKSFPAWQTKNASPTLLEHAKNGLIAETVIADELGIPRNPDDVKEHSSDGGVDVVVNGIPCDVKCATLTKSYSGGPLLKNGVEVKVIKKGKHVHELKNSLYIIATAYYPETKTVYVVGVMTTGAFIKNGERRTTKDGTEINSQQIGNFKHPNTFEEMISRIKWQDYFKNYGYSWDAENNQVIAPTNTEK